jgi:hypothetical protein
MLAFKHIGGVEYPALLCTMKIIKYNQPIAVAIAIALFMSDIPAYNGITGDHERNGFQWA